MCKELPFLRIIKFNLKQCNLDNYDIQAISLSLDQLRDGRIIHINVTNNMITLAGLQLLAISLTNSALRLTKLKTIAVCL